MALKKSYYNALQSEDVQLIRIMMKNSLLIDPTFQDLRQMENLAKSIPGLYEKHDGGALIMDKSQWNEDYMNMQMVQVIDNFSHERLEHLKEVVRYLHPPKISPLRNGPDSPGDRRKSKQSPNHQNQNPDQDQRDGNYTKGAVIGGTIAAGIVVGGTVAAAASASIVACAVCGAVVGGITGVVITTLNTTERK